MEGALSEARGDQEAATEEKEVEADLVGRLCKNAMCYQRPRVSIGHNEGA